MLYRNLDNWENRENRELLIYFAQRMDELTFEYTLDSHKPPTTTPPTLVSECLDAFKYSLINEKALPGALHLLDELETRMHGNSIIQSLLSIDIEKYFSINKTSPVEVIKSLSVLAGEIKPYPYALRCFQHIQLILQTDGNDKDELDFLCRELTASLINLGLSTQWIHKVVVEVFFESFVPVKFDIKSFWKDIFPHIHSFKVITPIHSKVHLVGEVYLGAFGTSIFDKKNVVEKNLDMEVLCGDLFIKVAVTGDIKAKDPFSAIEAAKRKISRLHHVYGLFNHKHDLNIGLKSFVLQNCCAKNSGIYSNTINRMQYVRDRLPSPAARAMETMIKRVRFPAGPDKEKFFNAVSFHGMSSSSDSVENQLVNIWTALETITPEHHYGSIISNFTQGVIPFIGLNYITRLTRCLLGDMLRWNRKLTYNKIKCAIYEPGSNLLQQFYCLLALDVNERLVEDLFREMNNFHLLRHRTYKLLKSFRSRKKTLALVTSHEQRVNWQIHRIYRTRNLIVHKGKLPSYGKSLIENAHDYFDQVFELRCALGGGDHQYNTYEDCFNYMNMRYNKYKDDLSGSAPVESKDARFIIWLPPQDLDTRVILPN